MYEQETLWLILLEFFGEQAEAKSQSLLGNLNLPTGSYILATVHRAENTDDPERLRAILMSLANAPLPVIFPAHPRTLSRIATRLRGSFRALFLVKPLGFLVMLLLERRASLVVTDSGGVQKEAYLQGTPCVTVRGETEWVELLKSG